MWRCRCCSVASERISRTKRSIISCACSRSPARHAAASSPPCDPRWCAGHGTPRPCRRRRACSQSRSGPRGFPVSMPSQQLYSLGAVEAASLLDPQRFHRFHRGGTARRKKSRHQSAETENENSSRRNDRIETADSIELMRQRAPQSRARGTPMQSPIPICESAPPSTMLTTFAGCAKRHADANLAGAAFTL